MIDPHPVRQLATLDTPVGLHTFPVENGAPVILDPRVPRNALEGGIYLHSQTPITIELTPGPHRVSRQHREERRSESLTVSVEPGRTTSLKRDWN